ncbi:MAG: OmpA family protein [Oligoflexia bacterium]|nr:OmpA family protein [Oligoflexia bacterium]
MLRVFIGIMLLSSCTSLPSRSQQPLIDITMNEANNAYQFCRDDEVGEWKCPKPTPKTLWAKEDRGDLDHVISLAIEQALGEKSSSKNKVVVEFFFGSAKIYPESEQYLKNKMSEIKDKKVVIKGFTDNIGSHERNKEIAHLRANKIKSLLISEGMKAEHIMVESYPLCCYLNDNSTEEKRKRNRRVEIEEFQEKGVLK